jgi:hypothetical protein
MKLTIKNAKATAQAMGARQVVVVAIDDNGIYGVVSYGVTKAECQAVRPLCDAIFEGIGDGLLPHPQGKRFY